MQGTELYKDTLSCVKTLRELGSSRTNIYLVTEMWGVEQCMPLKKPKKKKKKDKTP